MASDPVYVKLQPRRDTQANFLAANRIYAEAEPLFEIDTGTVRFGDGVSAYSDLARIVTAEEVMQALSDIEARADILEALEDPTFMQVQTNATDATPGRLVLTDYGYFKGNALGVVSQSGGIPTGAIIEQGSNANGEYTKFADGTMICRNAVAHPAAAMTTATGSLYRNDPLDITFPAAFSARPNVGFSGGRTSGQWHVWPILVTLSLGTKFTMMYLSSDSVTQDMQLSYTASGRWF